MVFHPQNVQRIEELFAPAVGEKAWGAVLAEADRYIVIEFGEQTPVIGDPATIAGKWHFVSYACAWRVEKDGNILAGSLDVPAFIPPPEDDIDGHFRKDASEKRLKVEQVLKNLDGLVLENVEIQQPSFDTIFSFRNGFRVRLFSIAFFGDEDGGIDWRHWSFYMPDGDVLIAGPGTNISIKKYRKRASKE